MRMNQFDTIKAVMKNLLLVILLIPILFLRKAPSELSITGKFFRDKQYYDYYLKENVKHLGMHLSLLQQQVKLGIHALHELVSME
jgi:hypothetical protein